MESLTYFLVLLSAFTHAYWNFVLKRANGTQAFIGLSKVAEIALFIVPFVYLVIHNEIAIFNYWLFYVIGAVLVILNYVFLGQAYNRGELSIVYPVSRAGALLFLPLLAYLFIGEKLDIIGLVSILLIVIGLFAIQLTEFSIQEIRLVVSKFRSSATFLALLAALTTACYTLWDKHSISFLQPFIYFYSYTAVVGFSYAIFILVKHPLETIKADWRFHRFSIIQVGFFNTFTYLLVLYALQTGKTSYVVALRQLSIVFGVILGWKILGEALPLPKRVGIGILLTGCLLISLAR
ncbi:MAG: EamA family transporter [Pyrinomonadaceae bacterium]